MTIFLRLSVSAMLCFLFIPLSYSYEFHDPTMPYIYWENNQEELKAAEQISENIKLDISMILVSPYSKTAVVNNETVGVGDMVSGVTIVDIKEYSITVKKNGMEWTIVWMADIMQDQGQ